MKPPLSYCDNFFSVMLMVLRVFQRTLKGDDDFDSEVVILICLT